MGEVFYDAPDMPDNSRDRLGVPSWRWVVMWAVLVGIILAGMFGILPQPTQDYYLVCVAAVAVGVALAVYILSWTHALLPHEHETICDTTEATKTHYLSYITPHERRQLMIYEGRGTASKGLMGTQGVPCFPKRKREGPGAPPRSREKFDTPVGRVLLSKQENGQGGFYPRVWAPIMDAQENGRGGHPRIYYVDHGGERRYNAVPDTTGQSPEVIAAAEEGRTVFFPKFDDEGKPDLKEGMQWEPWLTHARKLTRDPLW
jgi:hypothetical protein